jgi:hypothetical protein
MTGLQRIGVILATGSLITAAFLPGRQTVSGINAFFNGLSKFAKTTQGRG